MRDLLLDHASACTALVINLADVIQVHTSKFLQDSGYSVLPDEDVGLVSRKSRSGKPVAHRAERENNYETESKL